MEQETEYRQKQVEEYKTALMPLLRYLPWLEQSAGSSASRNYNGADVGENSMSFPVYDGNVLSFVKDAGKSVFMDRNYRYIYTRNHIKTHDDERKLIKNADINSWGILCGILSKYVLGGRTKGTLWNEAVKERIFYMVILRMSEIIEFWDRKTKRI